MDIIIISGRSGSGKTTALNVLEDIGFYCVDNLPVTLIPDLIEQLMQAGDNSIEQVAVGIDARNHPGQLAQFPNILGELKRKTKKVRIIYLDADDGVLLKRFSETRRKHPISNDKISLKEAIEKERKLLDPIAIAASLRIDSSNLNLHGLRDLIKERVDLQESAGMAILFHSFGFKFGIPSDTDFIFDVRCLPNPHWVPEIRNQTGLDADVMRFLASHEEVDAMITDIETYLLKWLPKFKENNRSYTTIYIGCTGGQHRSVYIVEQLTARFKSRYKNVQARHREILIA